MVTLQTNFTSTQAVINLIEEEQAYVTQVQNLADKFVNQLVLLDSDVGWTSLAETDANIKMSHTSGVTVDVYGSNFSGAEGSTATINRIVLSSTQGIFDVSGNVYLDLYTLDMSGNLSSLSMSLGEVSAIYKGAWNIASNSGTFTSWSEAFPSSLGKATLAYQGNLLLDGLGNVSVNSVSKFTLSTTTGKNLVYTGGLLDLDAYATVSETMAQALAGDDLITGSTGNESLDGFAGNDTINGAAGNDSLNGGTGSDSLVGGLGDDTYIVDSLTDKVSELPGQGADTVKSSVTNILGANIENLTLTGSGLCNGTGNTLANTLTGNNAVNLLKGDAGNDRLVGNAGNDTLIGGAGNDTLLGGSGNDTYIVNDALDEVTELASQGSDTVQVSITYTLGTNVENLVLTGTSLLKGTGNGVNNTLTGNSAANFIKGMSGNDKLLGAGGDDTLSGGSGSDTLTGGAGLDGFKFITVSEGGDNIADFVSGADKIQVVSNNFANLTVGALGAGRFKLVGTVLTSTAAVFLYDNTSGALSFDRDGNGAAAAVQFATLTSTIKTLVASDIQIVAA